MKRVRGGMAEQAPVVLFGGPSFYGLPNMSPFVFKVDAYLRLAKIPFERRGANPGRGPKGKMPWIDDGGVIVDDSSDILDHLERTRPHPLDQGLDDHARAHAHVVKRVVEEHLYFAILVARWIDPAGWRYAKARLARTGPAPVVGLALEALVRPQVKKLLHAQGLGRHALVDVYRRAADDLRAVATLLGDKPFVLGERPTTVDCSVFAMVASIIVPPIDNALRAHAVSDARLVAYVERVRKACGYEPFVLAPEDAVVG